MHKHLWASHEIEFLTKLKSILSVNKRPLFELVPKLVYIFKHILRIYSNIYGSISSFMKTNYNILVFIICNQWPSAEPLLSSIKIKNLLVCNFLHLLSYFIGVIHVDLCIMDILGFLPIFLDWISFQINIELFYRSLR